MVLWKQMPYEVVVKGRKFTFDRVNNDNDLEELEAALSSNDLSPGLETIKILHTCTFDTRGWVIIRDENNECAGGYTINASSNGINFGHGVCIQPKYRGQGLAKYVYDSPVALGNETAMSIQRFKFAAWSFKIITMAGIVKSTVKTMKHNTVVKGIQIEKLTHSLLPALLSYDSSVLPGTDRRLFTEQWTTNFPKNPKSTFGQEGKQQTLVAIDDNSGKVVGYGVTRSDKYASISPLYSDSPEVAKVIFAALLEYYVNKRIYYQCQAGNKVCWEVANEAGLNVLETEMRAYESDDFRTAFEFDKTVDYSRVYALLEYFPA